MAKHKPIAVDATVTEPPNLSSKTVNQIVADSYHHALFSVFGDSYISYRKLWDQAISGQTQLSYPLHVDFELFNACNYRCSFCPYSTVPADRPKHFNVTGKKKLDINLIEKVLIESKGRLCAVELGYNTEPLLSSEIIEIIKMCRSYGVLDIRMGTNGSLLSRQDYAGIITSGLTQLQISIDAVDAESYEKARNSKLFHEVTKSIKDLIATREKLKSLLPRVKVSYVMTAENKKYSSLFQQQWEKFADIIALQDLMIYPDASLNVQTGNLVEAVDTTNYEGCYMPKVRMSIRADGTVQPCCTVPGMKLKIGNINKDSLETLWMSSSMVKIRKSHLDGTWIKNKICSECITNTLH